MASGAAGNRRLPLARRTQAAVALHGETPHEVFRRPIMPTARKKSTSPEREYKTQRLELRIAPSAKRVIQEAMAATGLAAGDLAVEGARRLPDEHQRMVLQGADRDMFLAAISREPSPAPALIEALKRHVRQFG
ncbi:MAG: DUF1778 domain-containing protein [Roseiarcus sp.]